MATTGNDVMYKGNGPNGDNFCLCQSPPCVCFCVTMPEESVEVVDNIKGLKTLERESWPRNPAGFSTSGGTN